MKDQSDFDLGGFGDSRRWIRVFEHGHFPADNNEGEPETSFSPATNSEQFPAGTLPPLLLLHGFTGCAESWEPSLLEILGRDRRVLTVDLPGHGKGKGVPDPGECSIERVVDGLCSVLDEREIPEADWVGYSMGGRIALAAALLHPERVRRLVLESASPGIEDEVDRTRRKCVDDELAQAIEDRGIEWFVDYWMGLPLFETQGILPNADLQRARARRRRGTAEGYSAALRGLGAGAQPSYWGALAGVQHPVLLLTGELDPKYEEIAMRMAAALQYCEHSSIPGVGHAPHFEAPEFWLEAVLEFLDR